MMRDFTAVREVVRAYQMIAENPNRNVVCNIGQNEAISIKNPLSILTTKSSRKRIQLKQMPWCVRPNDIRILICGASKLERHWGWKPEIRIEQTLQDLLGYWRETIRVH